MKGPFELCNEDGTLYGFYWEPEPGEDLSRFNTPLIPKLTYPPTDRSVVEFSSHNSTLNSKMLPFKF